MLRSPRLYAAGALVAAAVAAQMSGAGELVTDRQRAEDFLTETGPLGPVAFVVLFALSHPVGLPSVALTFVAGAVWPAPLAMTLAWTGGMAGTLIGFSFARWIGREWVAARLPARFRRLEARVEQRAMRTVVLVRLFTYLPPPADWFFGVSSVRPSPFVVGTALGIVPPTIVIVLAGDRVTGWLAGAGTPAAVALGIGALTLGVGIAIARRVARPQRSR